PPWLRHRGGRRLRALAPTQQPSPRRKPVRQSSPTHRVIPAKAGTSIGGTGGRLGDRQSGPPPCAAWGRCRRSRRRGFSPQTLSVGPPPPSPDGATSPHDCVAGEDADCAVGEPTNRHSSIPNSPIPPIP